MGVNQVDGGVASYHELCPQTCWGFPEWGRWMACRSSPAG